MSNKIDLSEARIGRALAVTLNNPPVNIFGPKTIPYLNEVIEAIESDVQLKVVVFDQRDRRVFHDSLRFPFAGRRDNKPANGADGIVTAARYAGPPEQGPGRIYCQDTGARYRSWK